METNSIYLAILSLGAVLCLLFAIRELFRHGVAAIGLRPAVLFSLFFGIIHFVTPAIKHATGIYRIQTFDSSTLIMNAALSLLLYCFAIFLSRTKLFSPQVKYPRDLSQNSAKLSGKAGIILYLIGGFFAYRDYYIIEHAIGYYNFKTDLHAASEIRGGGRSISNLAILGVALYTGSWVNKKNGRYKSAIITCLMAFFMVMYYYYLSSRNGIMLLVVTTTIVWLSVGKQSKLFTSSGLRKFLVLTVIGVFLFSAARWVTIARYSLFDNAYYSERLEQPIVYFLDGAFGNDENLLWLSENDYPYYMGQTYLAGFLNVIPRRIWPEKPWGAGPELINLVRPGSYVRGGQSNNSWTTGMLTEARMNFGISGMVFSIVVWAFCSSRLIRRFHLTENLFKKVAFAVAALFFSSAFLYSEFLGFWSRLFVIFVPMYFLGEITRTRLSKGKGKHVQRSL